MFRSPIENIVATKVALWWENKNFISIVLLKNHWRVHCKQKFYCKGVGALYSYTHNYAIL